MRALVFLDISAAALRDTFRYEVATEDDDLGYEVIVDTVVEHSPEASECVRVVEPHV